MDNQNTVHLMSRLCNSLDNSNMSPSGQCEQGLYRVLKERSAHKVNAPLKPNKH